MGKEKPIEYIDTTSMSDFTKAVVKKKKIGVRKPPGKKVEPYKRKKVVYQGYNCLENIHPVRKYIQRYYGIDQPLLETLLWLFPKGFFTINDYMQIDKQLKYASVKRLTKLGYAKLVSKSGSKGNYALFTLTYRSKMIVENFYETLFGDRCFELSKMKEPFNKEKRSDKLTLNLIDKLEKKAKGKIND